MALYCDLSFSVALSVFPYISALRFHKEQWVTVGVFVKLFKRIRCRILRCNSLANATKGNVFIVWYTINSSAAHASTMLSQWNFSNVYRCKGFEIYHQRDQTVTVRVCISAVFNFAMESLAQ